MAKESGLGQNFYMDEFDLSNDTNSFGDITRSLNPLEFTGIDKLAYERKAGLLDGGINIVTYHNPTNAHACYKTLPKADRLLSVWHRPLIGAPVATMIGKQLSYNPTRGADGMLTAAVQALPNGFWVDWGQGLTAGKRTDTTATNGTGFDLTTVGLASSQSFGAQFSLHVFAFTGTSVTIKIQDSADNATFADLTGGTFTTVTAAGKERIQTGRTQTVRRYLRVATTGTFTNAVFAVSGTVNFADYTI